MNNNFFYTSFSQFLSVVLVALLSVLLLTSPVYSFAQTITEVANECSFSPIRSNLQVQTSTGNQNVATGRQLPISVTLSNTTPHQVTDVSVLLLVYKDSSDTIIPVDKIHLNDVLSIDPEQDMSIDYNYQVPSSLRSGDYMLRVMPIFGDRHSFSDTIALPSQSIQGVPFSVSGTQLEPVTFSDISVTSDTLTSNDNVRFLLPSVDRLQVNFALNNNTDSLTQGSLNWHLYDGRVTTETNRITSGRSESVSIQPQSDNSKELQVPLSNSGEYTLSLEFENDNGQKSYHYMSLVIQNISDTRIIHTLPITDDGVVQFCAENYGFAGANDSSNVNLTITDEAGEQIFTNDFAVELNQSRKAYALQFDEPFTAPSNILLSTENSSVEQWYLCDSNFVNCPDVESEDNLNTFVLILTVVLLLGGVLVLFIIKRRV